MHMYPSCANTLFYVSAHLMIIKILMASVSTNYQNYIHNEVFNVKPQYLSNKLLSLSLYIFVICILSCSIAYALDETLLQQKQGYDWGLCPTVP